MIKVLRAKVVRTIENIGTTGTKTIHFSSCTLLLDVLGYIRSSELHTLKKCISILNK
jgi:hypothetical protein